MAESPDPPLNKTPDRKEIAAANADAALFLLHEQVEETRAELSRLVQAVAEAENGQRGGHVAQLLEANEQLVLAMLRAHTDAETTAQILNEVSRHAELDPLTELPNRVLLLDRFTRAIVHAKRHNARLALLFLDLDNFKQINDTLGHAVGDEVLKLVAHRLASAVRASDTVSRHGGDEFLILLTEVSQASDAVLIADKIIAALGTPSRVGGHELRLRASIGISIYPDDGEDPARLIERADAAMYRAKRLGLGSFVLHDEQPTTERSVNPPAPKSPQHPLTHYELALAEHEHRHAQLREANEQLVLAALSARELPGAAEAAGQRQSVPPIRPSRPAMPPMVESPGPGLGNRAGAEGSATSGTGAPSSGEQVKSKLAFLAGGGEMGELMRAIDWSQTGVGPVETWSPTLRSTVRLLLANRFPLLLWWGPDYIQFYNDAYRPILGTKHPAFIGQPVRECWAEIWHILQPLIDTPFNGGAATWMEHIFLEINRYGFIEETHFTIAYSPVPDESAPRGIGGVLATVHEITGKVVGERRVGVLRDLGASAPDAHTAEEACTLAAEILARHASDVPFALLYLIDGDGKQARLAATSGIAMGDAASPLIVDLIGGRGESAGWPLAEVIRGEVLNVVDDLSGRFAAVPPGPWSDPPHSAVVIPIRSNKAHALAGLLVAGVSSRLKLDELYRSFLELLATQIATAIANARAYDEERRRAEALAEIDRAKTTFFSNVSHEFRTPLTLMMAPVKDVLADTRRPLNPEHREALETAQRNSLRLLRLVNTLLDFLRIEAGRVQGVYEAVDLSALTAELASNFRSACEKAGVHLRVLCDCLPEPVYVDRDMWEKIVLNLLSNAFKFTFDGEIEVTLSAVERAVELRVRDTGTGIPQHEMPRLFERFHRVQGAHARTTEGTGIGLALVQELVKLHGGFIRAESEYGVGTTFYVRLPFGKAHLPADQIEADRTLSSTALGARPYVEEALRWLPAETQHLPDVRVEDWSYIAPGPPLASQKNNQPRPRVLWADDNADMRDYVRRLLSPLYEVIAVSNGEQALSAARECKPDLVLTDIMMPGLDGFGLLNALRADPDTAALPVILLSARAGDEATIDGLNAGADDYLVKPFSSGELLARIRSQLMLANLRQERAEASQREQLARQQVELQKQDFVLLCMQAPNPFVILRGPDYIIELANPPACRLWRRTHEEVINRPLFDALPELRTHVFKELLDRVMGTGEPHEGKAIATQVDYRDRGTLETGYFNFIYSPLRNAQGQTEGILVVAFDVTDEVRSREQMNRLRGEAESANRMKDEFLAMLGHELRNPLAPMQTALQLMRLRGAHSREQDILERQVGHLTRLVDDLLDVSRITSGKIELRKEPVELAEALIQAVEIASPLLEQRRHRLEMELPRLGLGVMADLQRLAQVLSNLLTNAAKYSEVGSRIIVSAKREGNKVCVSVKDEGIGIAPDMIDSIFDVFVQQSQTIERSRGGLGLGLAIVRNLVQMHDGTVRAHSEGVGRGSEFIVELPAVTLATVALRRVAPTAIRHTQSAGKKILVVDDNRDAGAMLTAILEERGYTVATAIDGPSALEMAKGFQPDIALLDIGLPVMDGYELGERLRSMKGKGSGPRLVAVTGYGLEVDRERSRAVGFEAHLVKPVDIEKLIQVCKDTGAG